MQDHGDRCLITIDRCSQVKSSSHFRNPLGCRDKEVSFVLALDDEQTIEANIVDIDTMGQISSGIVTAETDATFKVIAIDSHLGHDRRTRLDFQF